LARIQAEKEGGQAMSKAKATFLITIFLTFIFPMVAIIWCLIFGAQFDKYLVAGTILLSMFGIGVLVIVAVEMD
jgi:hypothetical protein